MKHLTETALLMHGIPSISEQELLEKWPKGHDCLAWVDAGTVIIGGMEEFLAFKRKTVNPVRVGLFNYHKVLEDGASGPLTASGTMAVAQELGIPLTVTCGMGGFRKDKEEERVADLTALSTLPVALISTGPKDMIDRNKTFSYLRENKVSVLGVKRPYYSGYVFTDERVSLDALFDRNTCKMEAPLLLINEIPEKDRVQDKQILSSAVNRGLEAEQNHRYFHPAVNAEIDVLTQGRSSALQFDSIIENELLAEGL